MGKSIMEDPGNRTCWACGGYAPEEHHIFYGVANRKASEKYGLKVHLCSRCHRDNRLGIHGQNKELDQRLKFAGQRAFESHWGTREEFRKIFGKNYIDEVEEEMNRVILMGRLTRDPEVRYSKGAEQMAIARYTLAVDRRGKREENEQQADFISCIAFRKAAEFAEKYFRQGRRVLVSGRIQTGSYTNRDGKKVYTTDVIVDEQEFADSKGGQGSAGGNQDRQQENPSDIGDGFMNIPDGVEDEGLPFN